MSRLILLSRIFKNKRAYSSITIRIGNVSAKFNIALQKELVPANYLKQTDDKIFIRHLQWMLKKDKLGQDIFLVGYPGSYRRRLAMAFCELTQREVEYVSLSRDTTEADLKQRREMIDGSAVYVDQSALRAALKGRLLILEGVEKAERNVLPILNNLLENREMQLEDGRFLMRSTIYDELKDKYSSSELEKWRLVRCSEKFRVIALGLPVPRFPGHPLDPPLRSRFQARFLPGESYENLFNSVSGAYPNIQHDRLTKLVSLMHALRSDHLAELPMFPLDNAFTSLSLLSMVPQMTDAELIHSMYPYSIICNDQSTKLIEQLMNKFDIPSSRKHSPIKLASVSPNTVHLQYSHSATATPVTVSTGDKINTILPSFVRTETIDETLGELSLSHAVGDFCLIGPQGCGKSMILEALAAMLGARVTHVVLYTDMTSREMLQQRETDFVTGNTIWRHSALVRAALEGEWAVLGGLHRLEKGCLAVLSQIVSDRQLQLFDGSRLLREDRYEQIKADLGCDEREMSDRGIYKIHPNFRIIALADPPSIPGESSTSHSLTRTDWLTAEVLSNFRFHILPELSKEDERKIVEELVPNCPKNKISQLLEITHLLRSSTDPQMKDLSYNMSIRQLLRICRRLAKYPSETIPNAVHRACLSKFLPKHIQSSLNEILEPFLSKESTNKNNSKLDSEELQQLLEDYRKTITATDAGVLKGEDEAKVPNILFYDSIAHTRILLEMMEDFLLNGNNAEKQHLLLIGNQGVGKNKIVDRFLQLLNRPREYIQLHRDTTVQTLTLQPSIKDGRLIYEDSALVKAVSKGYVLVVDEADKASTQVTCILKTLLTVGDMDLSDGRRIIPEHIDISNWPKAKQEKIIRIHPQFRMIVLANRPGFPFLGNDFFGAMGDVFSCHAVDNPDVLSEIEMLQKYGPAVPMDTIKKLVFLFNDLRDMADQGHIQYPYSTREIVNIVRHLQVFPNESLSTVLGNVFDFDLSNKDMMTTLDSTLEKHGISLPGTEVRVSIARELPLPTPERVSKWRFSSSPVKLQTSMYKGVIKNLYDIRPDNQKVEVQMTRSKVFTELEEFVSIKFGEYNIASDMVTSNSGDRSSYIHVATLNPIKLYTIALAKDNEGNYSKLSSCKHCSQIDLSEIFPPVQGSFRPQVSIASLPTPYDSSVMLHEASTNMVLNIDTVTGHISRLHCDNCVPESKLKLRPRWYNTESDTKNQREMIKMHRNWSSKLSDPFIVFHKPGDDHLSVLHCLENKWLTVSCNVPLKTVHLVDVNHWLAQDMDNLSYVISRSSPDGREFTMQRIYTEDRSIALDYVSSDPIEHSNLHPDLGLIQTPATISLGISKESYVNLLPHSMIVDKKDTDYVIAIPRPKPLSHISWSLETLPTSGILVHSVDKATVPKQCLGNRVVSSTSISGYLEVVDLKSRVLKYLQIPSAFEEPVTYKWLSANVPSVFVARLGSDIVTVDNTGCVHKWTLCPIKLSSELSTWKTGIGADSEDDERNLMIERKEEDVDTTLGGAKHGKVDPTGAPHVGGNTWAGGTGGRDTAGLGGIGGPYRLDGGHDVYQVPDSIKASVPESVKKAAREVAEKAWKDRLRQIQMSELDYDLYMKYYKRVEAQINVIKVLIDTLQATAKERQWIRHRTHGDLDDGKLVEGVLGEKTIYRARGDKDPEPGSPQQKPKRLRIVADVSGSMYRFNGQDQRMERQLEAILMLMESFSGVRKEKMVYDICGHSGEGSQFPFIRLNDPPVNEKQRMNVLMEILAHSQFCISGDHTLEAIDAGIKDLKRTQDSMDQSFLVVLSDANLSRYGIAPSSVAKLLLRDKDIHSYIVFIGSLGAQAQLLKKALPPGRSFVCMDNEHLPDILRNIFTSTVLS